MLDAEILRCTPRCVGLCTDALPAAFASFPAMLRNDNDEPDREPSDSGYTYAKTKKEKKEIVNKKLKAVVM